MNSRPRRIFVICGDPGGASALSPVVQLLMKGATYSVQLAAYHQAATVFERRRLSFVELIDNVSVEIASSMLKDAHIDLLITGTSSNQLDLEKTFIAAAGRLGIPSLAVLDFWSNYALRFSDKDGILSCLPDKIAVMDRLAYDEMSAEGIPEGILVITGQPAFDHLADARASFSREDRARTRRGLGVGPDDWMVAFISQPFTTIFGSDHSNPGYPGYDEQTVFADLLEVLETHSDRAGRRLSVIVKPHLKETHPWWRAVRSDTVYVEVAGGTRFSSLALSADLVAGMTSTRLVEAAMLGCRTLSLQISAEDGAHFDIERLSVHKTVFSKEMLEREIDTYLSAPLVRENRKLSAPAGNAAEKVVALVCRMLEPEKTA